MKIWPRSFFPQRNVTYLTQPSKLLSFSEWAMKRNLKSVHPDSSHTVALAFLISILDLWPLLCFLIPVHRSSYPFSEQLGLVSLWEGIIFKTSFKKIIPLFVILLIVTLTIRYLSFNFIYCDFFCLNCHIYICFICSQIFHQPSFWFLPLSACSERPFPLRDYINSHIASIWEEWGSNSSVSKWRSYLKQNAREITDILSVRDRIK